MLAVLRISFIAALLTVGSFGQQSQPPGLSQAAVVGLVEKAAIAALNFHQGDAEEFRRARGDFTAGGWTDFMKHMQGFLDANGAPTFTSSFVALHSATVLDEKGGVLHFRIPGTLTQSNKLGKTTYRAAIEVYALLSPGKATKIQHLEQITCGATSTKCQ